LDLISNMLGSLVAVIAIWYFSRPTKEDEEE